MKWSSIILQGRITQRRKYQHFFLKSFYFVSPSNIFLEYSFPSLLVDYLPFHHPIHFNSCMPKAIHSSHQNSTSFFSQTNEIRVKPTPMNLECPFYIRFPIHESVLQPKCERFGSYYCKWNSLIPMRILSHMLLFLLHITLTAFPHPVCFVFALFFFQVQSYFVISEYPSELPPPPSPLPLLSISRPLLTPTKNVHLPWGVTLKQGQRGNVSLPSPSPLSLLSSRISKE